MKLVDDVVDTAVSRRSETPRFIRTAMLTTNDDADAAANALVERAVSIGGRDNVTVVVADVRG